MEGTNTTLGRMMNQHEARKSNNRAGTWIACVDGYHVFEDKYNGDDFMLIVIGHDGEDCTDWFEAWDLETVRELTGHR